MCIVRVFVFATVHIDQLAWHYLKLLNLDFCSVNWKRSVMGFDETDYDYENGVTSSVDEVSEMDSYSATASDEQQRDYKVRWNQL